MAVDEGGVHVAQDGRRRSRVQLEGRGRVGHALCKKVLETILDTVRSDIETNYEELDQLQIISDEATASGDNKENA